MVAPVMNYVISRAIASLSTAAQLQMDPNGTVMEQLMEEGAQRYIHGVANDFVDKYHKGELQVDPNAKEKLDQLVERCQTEGGKPANISEELALNVKGGKQGGVIELCVMAMLTKKPITVLQQQLNGEASEGDGSIQMVYTPPTIDKETGKMIDGHYELASGTNAKGGPNDCLYTAILSKTQGQFPSVDEMRTQCAAFILANPSFISGIHPALSIIDQTRNPLRWKQLMGEGGNMSAQLTGKQRKILSDLEKKAKTSDFKLSEKNNLDQQCTTVMQNLADTIIPSLENDNTNGHLAKFLNETEAKYEGRTINKRKTSGCHAMHGKLEGFFTVDVPASDQYLAPERPFKGGPGSTRYLFEWNVNKSGNIKQITFMGVCDTHDENVMQWNKITDNKNDYIPVKNRAGEEYGVKKVTTK
ncbi:unnamed protein product [Rotaria sp. Silwood1]|nr:unnamed protein product [Rotaria sp. Silwood1]